MVLETILADVLHQFLQIVNLRHSNTAIHAVWVIGDFALAQVRLDTAFGIVRRDAEEGKRAFANLGIDSTKGVDLTQSTT